MRDLNEIKSHLGEYLRQYHGVEDPSKAFRCLNPDHEDRHPSMSYDEKTNKVHCFSCGKTYDLIDLVELEQTHSKDLKTAIVWVDDWLGKEPQIQETHKNATRKPETDFRYKYPKKNETSQGEAYLSDLRGFKRAKQVMDFFQVVSDAERIYFPHDLDNPSMSYQSRVFDENGNKGRRYSRPSGMKSSVYDPCGYMGEGSIGLKLNQETVKSFCFVIVEGEIDFLSIEDLIANGDLKRSEEGDEVFPIGLSSTQNTKLFANALDRMPDGLRKKSRFIIATDNDRAGKECSEILKGIFKKRDLPFIDCQGSVGDNPEALFLDGCKDANDSLKKDRKAFAVRIRTAVTKFEDISELQKTKSLDAYREANSATSVLNLLKIDMEAPEELDNVPMKTHFRALDALLGDELMPGSIFSIGGYSGTGKTTLALQIADQMAVCEGRDILYFCLEQSPRILLAKSLSRLTFFNDRYKPFSTDTQRKGDAYYHASKLSKTATGILQKQKWRKATKDEKEAVKKAEREYALYSDRIFFFEPKKPSKSDDAGEDWGMNARDISEIVKNHIAMTGNKPVVFIDYLQILTPMNQSDSNLFKTIEDNFKEIKKLAVSEDLLVFVISALNRSGEKDSDQGSQGSLTAFRGSAIIEYSSDYAISLQDRDKADKKADKKARERDDDAEAKPEKDPLAPKEINMTVLKNRLGEMDKSCRFQFYGAFNAYFPKDEGGKDETENIFSKLVDEADLDMEDLPF